ncbi:MAG: DUF222 domain-containing protein [Nocardioidaceae bacterium]|nr:DUF222 domain-containing protein [Nocardioidaceae bacterium]
MTATVHERSGSVASSGDGALPPSWRQPLAVALTSVEAALDEVADAGCWSLSDAELAGLVDQAWSVRSRLDEVCLRLATAADTRDPGEAFAATSTTGWLRASQRVSRRAAAAEVRLGTALNQRCPVTRAALSAGEVNTEQAAVIVVAMGRLPRDVTDNQRRACEAHLVDLAATFGPEELRVLGRRVWEAVDPEGADAAEGRLLAAEEAAARATTVLHLRPQDDGSTRGRFVIPAAQADMLQAALQAMLAPRRPSPDRTMGEQSVDPDLDNERLPYAQRLGLAFCEVIEHLPVEQLPQAGRSTPTVTVTMSLSALVTGVGAATLSTGTMISAGQARRLACNADLVPQVLGGDSVVLDAGRARRFHNRQQRAVMGTTQVGCIADGCDRPPAWCEAHHPTPWAAGGQTDVNGDHGGVLLCGRHHHLVHANGWEVVWAPDHVPELVPPARIDPNRTPIRHRRFSRRRTG